MITYGESLGMSVADSSNTSKVCRDIQLNSSGQLTIKQGWGQSQYGSSEYPDWLLPQRIYGVKASK